MISVTLANVGELERGSILVIHNVTNRVSAVAHSGNSKAVSIIHIRKRCKFASRSFRRRLIDRLGQFFGIEVALLVDRLVTDQSLQIT